MMPFAPTSLMAMPTSKPKIGFSIDSIVGNGLSKSLNNFSRSNESLDQPLSPFSDCSYPTDLNMQIQTRLRASPIEHRSSTISQIIPSELRNRIRRYSKSPPITNINSVSDLPHIERECLKTRALTNFNESLIQRQLTPDEPRISRSPSPISEKAPILVPGIKHGVIRPFHMTQNLGDIKSLPPYLNTPEILTPHPNPHFLAAQFQMAAALAHGQAGHGIPTGPGFPQHPSHFQNPNLARDSYPLYPWLLSRHGRIFPNRFPGNFLLQPYRKPKRVRTAFSPSQLLKLEHAFESNHYVVGAERKTLAQTLSLTETQVKVWFQNRRTKHKRMQQEEDNKDGNGNHKMPSSPGNNSESQISYDEDELIDMEDCPSDEESNSPH